MMSFKQYLATQQLDEGLLRSAALLAWSNKSKSDGDRAVAAFQDGKRALLAVKSSDTLDDKVKRTQAALALLFDGLTLLRQQIGTSVALNLSGHLLAAQTGQTLLKKK
jgi:hypothetical protein